MMGKRATALLLAAALAGPAAASPPADCDYLRGLAYRNGADGLPRDPARRYAR